MKITKIDVYEPFKYIWLKSVEEVDLNVHCARCLIGNYDNRINAKIKHLENIELKKGTYYLCGVSSPYVWKNNFHLAFCYEKGSFINYSSNGITVMISNARMLPIDKKYIDYSLPQSKNIAFCRCRNWQFANFFLKNK